MKASMKIKKSNNYLKVVLFIMALIIFSLKTMLFMGIAKGGNGIYIGKIPIDLNLILAHISLIVVIIIPYLFFKNKGQLIYLVTIDLLYTVLLIGELLYFRHTKTFISIRGLVFPYILNAPGDFIFNFHVMDLLFLIDLPIVFFAFTKIKKFEKVKRNIVVPMVVMLVSVIVVYYTHVTVDKVNITEGKSKFMQEEWSASEEMANMSPLGYQIYEAKNTINRFTEAISQEEIQRVENWLAWNNEELPENKYSGILKEKNVIFLQVESLEDFVINQKVDGQEITPNINKLMKNSFYFENMYEQNYAGSSVDCDLMVNTSVLPLGDSITFLTHSDIAYNSLPKIMKSNGYTSSIAHAVSYANFHWGENAKSLGYEKIWSDKDFQFTKWVGGYRADEEYLSQYADKLKNEKEPFMSTIATITSHGPFHMQDENKALKLSDELNENRLGEYFQSINYTDRQIGMFIEKLDELELLDDSIIVLYGDHAGVHKYYKDLIQDAPLKGDWWQEDNMKLPLLIYSKGLKGETIKTYGGQSDIMPTILSLMGIEYSDTMGRNLLNTKRNATVYVDRDKNINIAGNVKSEEEKAKLEEAYSISELIIKGNYYKEK